jgi:dimethylamine monooxygenase subunit A
VHISPGQHLVFDPFDGRPFRLRVAARPLDLDTWLVVDEHFEADMAEKSRLLSTEPGRAACVAMQTDDEAEANVEASCKELLERIHHHQRAKQTADGSPRAVDVPPGLSPIDEAGRLTQEDWCVLLQSRRAGPYVLRAASLCFPNRWRLSEKLGHPISAIHEPVPLYAEQIAAATDALIARVTVDRPVWRINWSITDDPRLHQPSGHFDPGAGTRVVSEVGSDVFLRIERQTLIRLPETGAVIFGIRTLIRTLSEVISADSSVAHRIATSLRTMPDGMREYKSLGVLGPTVIDWLDSLSAA